MEFTSIQPRSKSIARLFTALMLVALPACHVPNSKIEGRDNGVFMPAGRFSVDLRKLRQGASKDGAEAAATSGPRRNEFHLLLELNGSYGEGEFRQTATPAEPVSLGGQQFTTDVDVDLSLFRTSLALRAANRFSSGIGIDGFIGIDKSDLDIKLSDGVTSDSKEHETYGPIVGATFSYSPLERLRFYVEGSVSYGFESGVDSVNITALELGAAVTLCEYAQFVAGWRRVTYEAELDDFVASDLDLKLSGPLLALWVNL